MKFLSKRIYADAAASTPLSPAVKKEIFRLIDLFGNPSALHTEALAAREELEATREKVAKTLGAHSDEIVFTGSGTEANNLALQGLLRPLLLTHGELHAITTTIEHPSILETFKALEREGLYVTQLPVDREGRINIKDLREAITEQTVLVSIQTINSEIGTIQDIHEVAKEVRHIRKARGSADAANFLKESKFSTSALPLYLHTDASQAPLWMPLKVEKLGVDLMTLDAQKMLGPKGVGVLYIKRGVEVEPVLWGGGQERGRRSGTENVLLAGALAVVLEDAQQNWEAQAKKVAQVRDTLWSEIKNMIPDAILNGASGEIRVANNVNISIPDLDGEMAVIALNAEDVAASTRSACDTEEEEPSHVLKAIGVPTKLANSTIRVTFLPTATTAQARLIAKKLLEVSTRYRQKL
jgi:cysteine desulfurase